MVEIGEVNKVEKGYATVKLSRKEQCSKCGLCFFPKNADSILVRCENKAQAKVGDMVKIQSEGKGKLLGAILVFLVPLILIGISTLISILAIGNELFIPLIAVALIIIWYAVLSAIDKKLKNLKGFRSVILEVVKPNPQINEEEKNNNI